MNIKGDRPLGNSVLGGVWGLLIGDALGVPYEFHEPKNLPPPDQIDMIPPENFPRSFRGIPPGTWSDDGAQALCLTASLLECGEWKVQDFAQRLLWWRDEGYLAVDGHRFDIGVQTSQALHRLACGIQPRDSGLGGERNNGNGSLMRCLPLALFGPENDRELVQAAHEQSRVTHAHPRAQSCCALYVLWARQLLAGEENFFIAWNRAVEQLSVIYEDHPAHAKELRESILPLDQTKPRGTGYVVDCLYSARAALAEKDYAAVVRRAISFGHDTDTTACVAGGLAGLRWGWDAIPRGWRDQLRGRPILQHVSALILRQSPGGRL